jgi:two-component system sensor histidine kinase AdeS
VRAHVERDAVVLSVIDDGVGVDGLNTDRLFDPFQQGPRLPEEQSRGTGLGLAIVRAVAAGHGGTAAMFPNSTRGTTVQIRIPSNGTQLESRSSTSVGS